MAKKSRKYTNMKLILMDDDMLTTALLFRSALRNSHAANLRRVIWQRTRHARKWRIFDVMYWPQYSSAERA